MLKTASLRDRTRANRANAKIRRNGGGTMTEHCVAQGLRKKQARSMGGSLRRNAKELGLQGAPDTFFRNGAKRDGARYTEDQVGLVALVYRPRLEAYKLVAAELRRLAN